MQIGVAGAGRSGAKVLTASRLARSCAARRVSLAETILPGARFGYDGLMEVWQK